MEKIKVLHVLGGLDAGGAETFVMNIYRNIDKEKFQFDFVVHNKEKKFYIDEIHSLGGKVFCVPRYRIYNHFEYVRKWKDFFKKHTEYHIVHCHVRSTASIILKIAKKYGIKTICHSHSTSNGGGISALIKNLYQKEIVNYADYLFGCSEKSIEWLYGKEYLKNKNCFVINNAIDTKRFLYDKSVSNKIKKEFGLEKKFIIGQIGRLSTVKNHIFSIKLLNEYLKVNKSAFLLIVGSGPLKENLVKEIKRLKLENNVLILSERSDVNEIIQCFDIFLMPSLYEGLPLSLVEAQAASLPCIISDNVRDGKLIKELIEQIPLDNNYQMWIKAIEKKKNNKKIDRMKEIKAMNFDIDENVKWLEKFYEKL